MKNIEKRVREARRDIVIPTLMALALLYTVYYSFVNESILAIVISIAGVLLVGSILYRNIYHNIYLSKQLVLSETDVALAISNMEKFIGDISKTDVNLKNTIDQFKSSSAGRYQLVEHANRRLQKRKKVYNVIIAMKSYQKITKDNTLE